MQQYSIRQVQRSETGIPASTKDSICAACGQPVACWLMATKTLILPAPEGHRHCPRCKGKGTLKGTKLSGTGTRNKGKRGEREVIDLMQPVVDGICRKLSYEPFLLQRNTIQAHVGGYDIHGLELLAMEVKFCENEQVSQWWAQTLRQAKKGQVPVLFYRASGQPWKVKLRIYIETPKGADSIEVDATVDMLDFLSWFENALEEWLTPAKV